MKYVVYEVISFKERSTHFNKRYISLDFCIDKTYWFQKNFKVNLLAFFNSINDARRFLHKRFFLTSFLKTNTSILSKSFSFLPEDKFKLLNKKAKQIFKILHSRSLLLNEVEKCLQKNSFKITLPDLLSCLQLLYLHGKLNVVPGVCFGSFFITAKCNRCFSGIGGITRLKCSKCDDFCAFCKNCAVLGQSSSCTPFFLFSNNVKAKEEDVFLKFKYLKENDKIAFLNNDNYSKILKSTNVNLTKLQQRVSDEIFDFIFSSKSQCLVWAVTGAGKTEIMIPLICFYLSLNLNILWTTPRRDVVLELAPRLKEFFPYVDLKVLCGGSKDLWLYGKLVISTAIQTLRFHNFFHLIIVDEVDAFPLDGNKSSELGIKRAGRNGIKYVFLTATPKESWKERINKGFFTTIILPSRYHGLNLPIPSVFVDFFLYKKLENFSPIKTVVNFLDNLKKTDGQALIFVPRVLDIEKVVNYLKAFLDSTSVDGVYSQDKRRNEKVLAFRQGKLTILITTTILERGVTVPRCHVLVFGAQHYIFDKASLIQIAGRVGRNLSYTKGVVWFLATQKTEAQVKAIKEIEFLNFLAQKKS